MLLYDSKSSAVPASSTVLGESVTNDESNLRPDGAFVKFAVNGTVLRTSTGTVISAD